MGRRTLILARHGRTQANVDRIYSGRNEEPLSPEGAAEAERLAPSLEGRSIGAVFASPVTRARQTAGIFARPLDLPITILPDLTEILMGPWKGLSEAEVEERFPEEYRIWMTAPARLKMAGRETLAEVQARTLAAIGTILKATSGAKDRAESKDAVTPTETPAPVVLAVTHVVVIRCAALHFGGRNLDDYKKIAVPNLSRWTFHFDGDSIDRFTSSTVER